MAKNLTRCPDCDESPAEVNRRQFLAASGAAALAVAGAPAFLSAAEEEAAAKAPETVVKLLFDTLDERQRKEACFDWDYRQGELGLLRTRVSNNWNITDKIVNSDFYTDAQRDLIRHIFEGIIQPDWHKKIYRQLEDDAGGFGEKQSIAIFGKPGTNQFEFVMTGRHMTIRCDGNSAEHVAFGGPIFYGHAAQGFNEKPDHPGNVFWPQALAANDLYKMLSGKQQQAALVTAGVPHEEAANFRGAQGKFDGLPVTEFSSDQKEHLQGILAKLIEPYRQSDRDEALACLTKQGGLDACHLAFYKEADLGSDGVWDNWRLEGPAFVWYFRGNPHVHVWVHVADDPAVKLNA